MKAQEWFERFVKSYYDSQEIRQLVRQGGSDGLWTGPTLNVLRKMGQDLGCVVTEEEPAAERKRSDQRWIKDNASLVYIEHENLCDANIDGEIGKLCTDCSRLKILITYVPDTNFRQHVDRLLERIERMIRARSATFTGEFLLVVSGWKRNDWEAHISALKMEPLKTKGGRK